MMKSLMTCLRWFVVLVVAFCGLVALGRAVVWNVTGTEISNRVGTPQIVVWPDTPRRRAHGYSAVIVEQDGAQILIASDFGRFIQAGVARDAAGLITDVTTQQSWPTLLHRGGATTRFQGDLEALTRLPDGRLGLGFEHLTRLQIQSNLEESPQALHAWNVFEDRFDNATFEALATLANGDMLAIMERADTGVTGFTQAYTYALQTGLSAPQPFPVTQRFSVTGADVGPDGCLYILERRYGLFTGFQFQLIQMDAQNWQAPRTLLYRSKPMSLGNAEGVSVWQRGDHLVATLITDDGFPPLSPTRIIELPLGPARDCADQ